MKRLILAIATAVLPFAASASPQLANDWGIKASSLYQETSNMIAVLDRTGRPIIPESYEVEIQRFAMTATRLGLWVDGSKGPSDLGCIFRGMAEEGEVQLDALSDAKSAHVVRLSLVRLAAMFSDAETIAVAAVYASQHETAAAPAGLEASCPVSAAAAHAALN